MYFIEYIALGIANLRRHLLRSSLTILGIVIGVGAVVSVVSIGDGSREMVLREIERTGGLNVIEIYRDEWDRQSGTLTRAAGRTVRRGRWRKNRAEHLETADANAILESAQGVRRVVPEDDFGNWNLNYKGKSKPSQVTATTDGYDKLRNWYVQMGRFLSDEDVKSARTVALIGSKVYEELFEEDSPIGKEIKATRSSSWGPRFDVRLTVVGVMEEKGDAMDTQGWDDRFIIPITTLQQRFKGKKHIERIRVEAADLNMVETAKVESQRVLGRRHQGSGGEYQYWTAKDELATAERIGNTMKFVMGGIAGIALFVAGIGIMNIMLVSVTERTKEIGLRKAIGAKRRDILIQFLIEAAVLSLTGGILGAIVGVFMGQGTALLITKYVWQGSDWPSVISFGAMVVALSVSIGIGIFFGLYPANKAAKLTPVEAIRSD